MRKLFALLIAMSALALVVIWMPGRDSDRQLAVVTEIAGKGVARVQTPAERAKPAPERKIATEQSSGERRTRSFSPDIPLVPAERPAPAPAPAPRETADTATDTRPSAPAAGELRVAGGVRQPAPSTTSRFTNTTPADEASRYDLVRNLQRELRRVGCYVGEIDGSWGGGSKRAMGAFLERANASLPTEQPDYILLSLIQGYAGQACGKGCPTGQSLSDGRCTPNVVLAQNSGKRTTSRDAAPGSRNTAADNGWAATVQVAPEASSTSSYAPTVAAVPLPGRMAIGAPRASETGASDPSGLGPQNRGNPSVAERDPPTTKSVRTTRTRSYAVYRPVVVYRGPRQSSLFRVPRRLSFFDVFR